MSNYTDIAERITDAVVSGIDQARELTVSAVGPWSEAAADYVPEIPFAEQLPRPHELVESAFTFASRVMKAQKSYTLAVLDAFAPVTAKAGLAPASRPKKIEAKSA